jgi:23S rRNA (cytosine1962-C5)-methyltransferase
VTKIIQIPTLTLKRGKEQSLLRFHPWIFSGAIDKGTEGINDGDIVKVCDNKNNFLAYAHYQPGSIAARIFSFIDVIPDEKFWREKIAKAWQFRKNMGFHKQGSTNVFRFINGEGDYFPSLIADYYNGTIVMQIHSTGMYRMREMLVTLFKEVLAEELMFVFDKSANTLPVRANLPKENLFVYGQKPYQTQILVNENDLKFKVDISEGQKTGFFIDQRDNRELLIQHAKGREVLNLFGYTGGFSVYALAGGAKLVYTVDGSKPAIEGAIENVKLNFPDARNHEALDADAFEFLKTAGNKFDLMILDPPAFAKHNEALHNALKGYQRLNAMAFEAIRPGGIIFTFSCSQVVSRIHFRQAVFGAAVQANRKVRILSQLAQPADHPIDIAHPEGEYLKGLVLYVE